MSSKQREALSDACYAMFNFLKTQNGGYKEMAEALDKAKAALAAPPRNCDVGSVKEQYHRFCICCTKHKMPCRRSYTFGCAECYAHWAQMPYEEEGAK